MSSPVSGLRVLLGGLAWSWWGSRAPGPSGWQAHTTPSFPCKGRGFQRTQLSSIPARALNTPASTRLPSGDTFP